MYVDRLRLERRLVVGLGGARGVRGVRGVPENESGEDE